MFEVDRPLEVNFRRELHQSRVADRPGDLTEARTENVSDRIGEVYRIERVEDFPANFKVYGLADFRALGQIEVIAADHRITYDAGLSIKGRVRNNFLFSES